jgi:pyridoxine kinase
VFPLQRLGAELLVINTVQFSNHPGYGAFTGEVFSPGSIQALVEGIAARGALAACDALLSGYIGDPDTGDVILNAAARLRAANPRALWCCDPVIGDEGSGIYVKHGIAEFFRARAVAQADILTPNQFELACLTGLPCASHAQAKIAIAALQARMRPGGPRAVLVTSFRGEATPDESIDLLAAAAGATHRLRVPRLPIAPNGAGDAIAGLFLFHMLRTKRAEIAMAKAASSIHGVLRATLRAGQRELALIAAQAEFVRPSRVFVPEMW